MPVGRLIKRKSSTLFVVCQLLPLIRSSRALKTQWFSIPVPPRILGCDKCQSQEGLWMESSVSQQRKFKRWWLDSSQGSRASSPTHFLWHMKYELN